MSGSLLSTVSLIISLRWGRMPFYWFGPDMMWFAMVTSTSIFLRVGYVPIHTLTLWRLFVPLCLVTLRNSLERGGSHYVCCSRVIMDRSVLSSAITGMAWLGCVRFFIT